MVHLPNQTKEKADVRNEIFGPDFTKEDVENMSTFQERQVGSFLTEIHLTVDDVCKKLEKLNPEKSPGPDGNSSLKEL